MDGVVPALGGPDGPRGTDVVRGGVEGVVASLAVDAADRVDRRQVEDVEPHVGHCGEALGRGAEAAADDLAGRLVQAGTLGAGEELVPGAVQRTSTVGEEREGPGHGQELTHRIRRQDRPHRGSDAGREPHDVGRGALAKGPRRRGQGGRCLGVTACGGALEEQRALGEHQLGVDARRDLDLGIVHPGAVGIAPAVDLEAPGALGVRGDGGAPPVCLGGHLAHEPGRSACARRVDENDLGAVGVVTVAQDQSGDLEGLTDGGLGRIRTSFDLRCDIQDRYASNHAREPTQVHARQPALPGRADSTPGGLNRPSMG